MKRSNKGSGRLVRFSIGGLRTITAARQHAEMRITCDNRIRIRGDGAVGELIIVPIFGNGAAEKG